jgi:hypothetical protein
LTGRIAETGPHYAEPSFPAEPNAPLVMYAVIPIQPEDGGPGFSVSIPALGRTAPADKGNVVGFPPKSPRRRA